MSDSFAPPAFNPAAALPGLKRRLRDLGLAERGAAFELKGRAVVELRTTPATIEARLAKRPAVTPEWTTHTLKAGPDVRRFAELVQQQLARWSEE
jgi:hypothetical protein